MALARRRHHVFLLAFVALALLLILPFTGLWGANASSAARTSPAQALEPMVRVELRSWVVFGRGRHLYALVHWPEEEEPEVVEYWSTARWREYAPPQEEERRERIAKMPRGMVVRPSYVDQGSTDRHEGEWELPLSRARALAANRVFEERYYLLGPNSTSGLRAAFRAAGLDFPARIVHAAGIWGEFPGVDLSPGAEVARERWGMYGIGAQETGEARTGVRLDSAPETVSPSSAYLK
ncbi:MAG: hypothetical protein AB7G17_01465 [Phycisphaerales bacterium]